MELADKKAHVLRCIKLRMDLYSSMILAELTVDEMAEVKKDEVFLGRVKLAQKMEEYTLLEKYNSALNIAVSKGNTKPIEYMLAKLNSEQWGKGSAVDDSPEKDVTLNINLKGVSSEHNDN